jgi:hypothetical protein
MWTTRYYQRPRAYRVLEDCRRAFETDYGTAILYTPLGGGDKLIHGVN